MVQRYEIVLADRNFLSNSDYELYASRRNNFKESYTFDFPKNKKQNKMKRSLLKIYLSLAVFICFSFSLIAQYKTGVSWKMADKILIPVPPAGHPRLYLQSSQAGELAKRMQNPVLQPVVKELRSRSSESLQLKIEWDAIQYLISKDKTAGRVIIDSALALLKRTELPTMGDGARVTGRMMTTGAIVYDWLYPLLTPVQKDAFIAELIRLAKTLECGYPPTQQGSITGHSSESFIMRDMLSAGIAIYDEYPEMYELAAARFFGEHLPARNFLYNGRAYHQGDSYGPLRYSWDTYPLMIFHSMGVDNIYNPEQQYVSYWYLYSTRPDGQRMRAGDTYLHSGHGAPPGKPWDQYVGTLFSASFYNDGFLLDHYLRQGISDGKAHGRTNQQEYIFQFLWWNVDLKRESIEKLPLSWYSPSPFGWMIARTGWDKKAVIAEMKVNVYNFSNHQHMDAGAFQIYYNNPLATESGLYGGTNGAYGSPHGKNYFWRTIAHNTLLIYDPDEKFSSDFGNDGGQRMPNGRSEPRNLEYLLDPQRGYQTGEVLAQGFGPSELNPDYTYMKGDITKAYSSKVKEVKRSFIFLDLKNEKVPAALIVYDKVVSSSPSFKKYWLIHSIEEPSVKGNEVTISNTKDGRTGKLVNTSLLPAPEDLELTPVGGKGKEFWVFGRNYENEIRDVTGESTYERAAWRVEASPKNPANENYFLNVMQVMENTGNKLTVKRIDGDRITGVSIGDRIVLSSKNSENIQGSFTFSIQETGNLKILLTDLLPGKWQVTRDDKLVIPEASVKAEDGILYFEGTKGKYTINRLAD